MLLDGSDNAVKPRNIVTISHLPKRIDKDQLPLKREPFMTVSSLPTCSQLSLLASCTPQAEANLRNVVAKAGRLQYCKVYMKLIDIVSGDFFSHYIKTGNVIMVSEGRDGVDNTYLLQEGVLSLHVDKATFESLGLEGKVIAGPGRKHTKARYAIELDLRSPSMVRGKKGFMRVLSAFERVLCNTQTWLFHNVSSPGDFTGPIHAFSPIEKRLTPSLQDTSDMTVPILDLEPLQDEDDVMDLLEWTSLATMNSPRVRTNDNIDTYLCRYERPVLIQGKDDEDRSLYSTHWHGLICTDFMQSLLTSLLKSHPAIDFLSLSAHAFDGSSYTIIKSGDHVATFRYQD